MMHSTMKPIATLNGYVWPILNVPQNFEIFMIGLGQEDEIEEIILQPEIWWHDAVYHEMDHCSK